MLKSLACQTATDILTHGFCKVKSRLHCELSAKLLSEKDKSVEDVLITISPKQSVIDAVNELRESGFNFRDAKPWNKFVGPVLDVCAYKPRSREWYYLYSLNDERAASTIIRSTSWDPWEYVCIGDRICCAAHNDTHKSPAYKLKLEDFSVDCVNLCEDNLPDGFELEYTRILATKENVYSLSLGTEITEYFIECIKFTCCDIFNANDPDESTGHVFSLKNQEVGKYSHIASLSPYCNEMLIVMGHGRAEEAYVVDLNPLEPSTKAIIRFEIKDEYKSQKQMQCWIQVVVGNDKFYVIEVTKEYEQCHFKVSCVYEYEYGSLRFTCRKATVFNAVYVPVNTIAPGVLTPHYPPLIHEHVFQAKESAWIFTGNERDTSSLFEIFEKRAGRLGLRVHTPPPFPYIIGTFSAQLSHSFLANKDRVIKYLLPK